MRQISKSECVPFPGFKPKTRRSDDAITGARYWICTNGHVLRVSKVTDDLVYYDIVVKPFMRGKAVNVRLAGGAATRSLPLAMAEAFATVEHPDDGWRWSPIIKPGTPEDDETGVLRCGVKDIVWTPYAELCRYARKKNSRTPTTLIPII